MSKTLKRCLPPIVGRVIDVGSGASLIERFSQATESLSIDVIAEADHVIALRAGFPFEDDEFDVVFVNQMFDHVENLSHTLGDMARL